MKKMLIPCAIVVALNTVLNGAPLPKSVWTPKEGWSITDEVIKVNYESAGKNLLLLANQNEKPRPLTVAAKIRINEIKEAPDTYKNIGVVVAADWQNYFILELVESPKSQNFHCFVELKQMRKGQWPSKAGIVDGGKDYAPLNWEHGEEYTFTLTVNQSGATGTVSNSAGKIIAELKVNFSSAEAISAGYFGLFARDVKAEIKDIDLR